MSLRPSLADVRLDGSADAGCDVVDLVSACVHVRACLCLCMFFAEVLCDSTCDDGCRTRGKHHEQSRVDGFPPVAYSDR